MHWLSYSHSDQALLRDPALDNAWDSLVVPGTLATFYFAGTGGFVLSRGRPYIIDPRTPLLQRLEVGRSEPKQSHLTLAEIHDPDVVGTWPQHEIELSHWQDGRWEDVVRRTVDFQEGYSTLATQKVDKYAALLQQATGRTLAVDPVPPLRIVPPYWAVSGKDDPWWTLSQAAIEQTLRLCAPERVMPILTLAREVPIAGFVDLLGDLPEDCQSVFAWRGAWDELEATPQDIRAWQEVIEVAHGYDVEITNLYGGYLSVLLTGLGLDGVNHGVGYSEQRDARRLGATGAPPTRYYLPALRYFVPMASAQPIIDFLPAEWSCDCSVCEAATTFTGRPIVEGLSSEDLKRHFLICRQRELDRVAADLEGELDRLEEVAQWLGRQDLPVVLSEKVEKRLNRWASTIRELL